MCTGDEMIEFIKRNKVFTGCLMFLGSVACVLVILNIVQSVKGSHEPVIPDVFPPQQGNHEPFISDFTGNFSDETNTVELNFSYEMSNHTFLKTEIVHNNTVIQELDQNAHSLSLPIHLNNMTTGNNEFELRVYYDEGIVMNKTVNVFIDYVFDIVTSHQLVDNNLGKGYLVSIKYHYSSTTPVGIPRVNANSTIKSPWSMSFVDKKSTPLQGTYMEVEAFYMIYFEQEPDQEITWDLSYVFESVGVRYNDSFTEKTEVFSNENIQF